ncbi:MAG: Gfo/Idh/MocA family oxidoreductase [Candidatus Aminicenantes bacterium]|nr:Gfo/Idh/MocA family oxidoreductase [Candidatus Aminicenantes bacterium]MDH5742383.1 Gfo/Idh/MocA family oxidoreductase [Candidatus Aminicenantes bacterium]
MEKKIRTGVIGLGKMGILHSALINMMPQAELVAVHDVNRKLSKYVTNSGMAVTFYPNLEQMLDESGLDAVFVCTPPFTHLSLAKECIDRHLNVFVEKPLAESLSSAKKMVSFLEGKDIIHATGFTLAHIPLYRKAKDMLEKGILGKIYRFNISVYFSQVLSKKRGWFYDKKKSGGGVVIDIASHLIYLVTWYFGLPQRVYGRTSNFFSDVEDSGSVLFEYTNGLSGVLDANWSLPGYRLATIEISLEGEKGFMEITNDYIKLKLHQTDDNYEQGWTTIHKIDLGNTSHFDLGSEGFYDEDRHFIECCLERVKPDVTWEDGLDVQRIIEAIYLSSRDRCPIDMELIC